MVGTVESGMVMGEETSAAPRPTPTPDQRLRVYISADPAELADEREAIARAVRSLRLAPVLVQATASPYPPPELYRAQLEHSDVFVGAYAASYGWLAAGMDVSALEDEFELADRIPRLIYVRQLADRDADLTSLLARMRTQGSLSYRTFSDLEELERLVADDLAVLLTERFETPAQTLPDAAGRSGVPATPTTFVGREQEIARLTTLLRDPQVRLVTVSGPGGVGKTRLALEVAQRMAGDFPDGAVVLWLDALRDPDFLLQAIGAQLQIKETPEDPLHTAIANRLRGTRMLIILDNFEHIVAAAPTLAEVVAMPTASKFLVTSRQVLAVRGEHVVEVAPLPLPDDEAATVAAVGAADGVRLFVDRAQAAAPGFELTADNAAAVAEVVRHLEGVPLALELAAARVRMLPPAELLQRLHSRLDLPGSSARDLPQRQRTLRSMIDWSYQLLEDPERQALEQLSVFPAGADLDGALLVLAPVADDPVPLLESLLSKSLIRRVEVDGGQPRVRLLAAIREFAAEHLELRGGTAQARQRHARYIADLADRTAQRLHSEEQVVCLETFDRELENLQAALEWYWSQGRTDDAMGLANSLRWYWSMRGHLSAADAWMGRLLAMEGAADGVRGEALTTAGVIALEMGDRTRAAELFATAVHLVEAAQDADGIAWARTGLGAALAGSGDLARAEELQEQALETFREGGDLLGQCTANTRIAMLALARGDYAQAEDRFLGSLEVRRKIKDLWGTAYVLTELGWLRLLAGDVVAARDAFSEALGMVRRIGYRDGTATALDGLGRIAAAEGRWDDAEAAFREAAELYWGVGNRAGRARALAHLARAELEVGGADAAAGDSVAAFELADRTGSSAALAAAIDATGCVLAARGAAADAALLWGAAAAVRDRHRIAVPDADALGPGAHMEIVREALGADLAAASQQGAALEPDRIRAVMADAAARLAGATTLA